MRETAKRLKSITSLTAIVFSLLFVAASVQARSGQAVEAPPANDNFANAEVINGVTASIGGTNVDATSETNEPNIVSGGTINSVWYKLTAPMTGSVNIDTNGPGTIASDTSIGVFVGASLVSLNEITANSGYVPFGYSRMTFGVQSGTVYYIKVEGFGALTGTFTLNYALTAASPNDNFASARSIYNFAGSNLSISDTNVGSTGETGEPNHAGGSTPLNSVWYSWVAPSNITMTFETVNSTYDTTLAVYTGAAVNSLTLITEDDDMPNANSSRVTFAATAGTTYYIAVDGFGAGIGTISLNWHVSFAESGLQFSFYIPGWTDFTVYRPSNNTWYTVQSASAGTNCCFRTTKWGQAGDVPVSGDYDGDSETDIGIFRPSNGSFYIRRSSDGGLMSRQWGVNGDLPVQGDFDGDDRADFAVFRPSTNTFYVFMSEGFSLFAVQWGQAGDIPAVGDYDGDGKTDIAVFRKNPGTPTAYFYVRLSTNGSLMAVQWGNEFDQVVPGDYDRDGKTDIAVFRASAGAWYIRRSSDGSLISQLWGSAGDLAEPGDYDADGKTDVAVFRPSNGNHYVLKSQTGTVRVVNWGTTGDTPVPSTNAH
jgi:hypothetical protein